MTLLLSGADSRVLADGNGCCVLVFTDVCMRVELRGAGGRVFLVKFSLVLP